MTASMKGDNKITKKTTPYTYMCVTADATDAEHSCYQFRYERKVDSSDKTKAEKKIQLTEWIVPNDKIKVPAATAATITSPYKYWETVSGAS